MQKSRISNNFCPKSHCLKLSLLSACNLQTSQIKRLAFRCICHYTQVSQVIAPSYVY